MPAIRQLAVHLKPSGWVALTLLVGLAVTLLLYRQQQLQWRQDQAKATAQLAEKTAYYGQEYQRPF